MQLTEQEIAIKIHFIRSKKVMLDYDLSKLYGVDTKQLKRQFKRNIDRFPEDFMFELTKEEFDFLRCQIGTSSWGGTRFLPIAFTEQGVAMLSGVLNSKTAIKINIQIIRIFIKMRESLFLHKDVLLKLEKLEKELNVHGHKISKAEKDVLLIFEALKQLLTKPVSERQKIGFKITN